MGSPFDKHQKRRLISSYFSVVISIALVLFLLGLLGLLVLNAKTISDNFKEQVVMTIYLSDNAKQVIMYPLLPEAYIWILLRRMVCR